MSEGSLRIDTPEISNRTYEQYVDLFCLADEELAGKQILDLAGGLSDFSRKVNAKYGDTGTVSRSVDTAYKVLADLGDKANYDSFNRQAHDASGSIVMASDQTGKNEVHGWEASAQAITDRLHEMREERLEAAAPLNDVSVSQGDKAKAIDSLPQVAGSADRLPFKDASMDLVLSSNYLLYPMGFDKKESIDALHESIRVLKEHGELRITPPGGFRKNNDQVILTDGKIELSDDGKIKFSPNTKAFEIFSQLEKEGCSFYYIEDDKGYSLLVKKDNQPPVGLKKTPDVIIRKLNFEDSNDSAPNVPYSLLANV